MILLDTQALIWVALEPKKLTKKAQQAIREARAGSGVAIAAITLFEVAWLVHNQRIQVNGSLEAFVRDLAAKVNVLPITSAIATQAVTFPPTYPRDPQDRLIGATAIVEGIPLVTSDRLIRGSNLVQTIW